MENSTLDELVERAVGKRIQNDMEMVSKTFYSIVEKYSFLFDGDTISTQGMLIESCFPKDIPLIEKSEGEEEDRVHFDMDELLKHIPEEMKRELYQRILNKFVNNINVEDLHNK